MDDWALLIYPDLLDIVLELKKRVEELKAEDESSYQTHSRTRQLAVLYTIFTELVPTDPADPVFNQGNTLGKKYRKFKRVKHLLPYRYRLFFVYSGNAKKIIYIWMNDETCLRQDGAKTDVYVVFTKMLDRNDIPSTFSELDSDSKKLPDEDIQKALDAD